MTATMTPPPAPYRPRRRGVHRVRLAFGLLLILAGLSVLGYMAWQYWGTNIISKQQAEQAKTSIANDWGKGIDGDNIGLLRVPRFGADYEKPIVRGFDQAALARGVGWFPKSVKPGEVGNFVIAGHRVTHGEPFAKFPELRRGDKVVVETRTGIYTYVLRNSGTSITVPFTVSWPLQKIPDPDPKFLKVKPTKKVLTMVTCSELFHTDNRNVVIGDLVKAVEKPGTKKR